MTPQGLFVATVAACLVNGFLSPMLVVLMALHPVWMPEMLRPTNETVFYGASLMVSTGTLLLSGMPAALAERLAGLSQTAAMGVWLAGALTLVALGLG